MFGLFQLETSAQEVHENLNGIIDYQTHHRFRETQVCIRGEDLNEKVKIWSVFVTLSLDPQYDYSGHKPSDGSKIFFLREKTVSNVRLSVVDRK